ncbi:MAG: ATP-binding cassette domain-containing protein [Actinobacteria bacterium]|nr:ATP-binding cassette domain-containing protein [Actinomycetota bacterium]
MAAIRMSAVTVWRWVAAEQRRAVLLRELDWTVEPGQHWVVLGPNGAGKTTLLNLAAAVSHPSEGTVEVLGERLGAVDMRTLRESIGTLEPGLSRKIRGRLTGLEVVLTGATGSIALLHDRITPEDRARAERLMVEIGVEPLRDRRFEDCSQGERQRLLLARSLMDEPDLLLLDEPTTGLDLPSRERLIASLDTMAEANHDLPTVIVTHHLEEIPSTTTHALLLRQGAPVASGQIAAVLTSQAVSTTFDIEVQVAHNTGRWAAMVLRS